jgi:hypothetical protein
MADSESKAGIWPVLADIAKTFGLGGVVLLGGIGLIGLAIFKAPEIADPLTQAVVVMGSLVVGCVLIALGSFLLRQKCEPVLGGETREHDIFIAAPMAGFEGDEAGRIAAVDLVRCVEVALRQLPGIKDVYTPILARPEASQYETPATAFDIELKALSGAKRYVLILPKALPAGTSVLVTAGMAIGLKIPSVILAHEDQHLPYLLDGAVQSRNVNVHLYRYANLERIKHIIQNDGLRLFGEEAG